MDDTASERQWVTCPGCEEPFDPTADLISPRADGQDGMLQCPFCSTRFAAPDTTAAATAAPAELPGDDAAGDDGFYVIDDERSRAAAERAGRGEDPDDEVLDFNAAKVRRLSAVRRAENRTRSYLLVAGLGLSVASIQLIINAVRRTIGAGTVSVRALFYLSAAILLVLLAWRCIQRAREIAARLRHSDLPEPTAEPDFSTLNDGSQYWNRLDDMRS